MGIIFLAVTFFLSWYEQNPNEFNAMSESVSGVSNDFFNEISKWDNKTVASAVISVLIIIVMLGLAMSESKTKIGNIISGAGVLSFLALIIIFLGYVIYSYGGKFLDFLIEIKFVIVALILVCIIASTKEGCGCLFYMVLIYIVWTVMQIFFIMA